MLERYGSEIRLTKKEYRRLQYSQNQASHGGGDIRPQPKEPEPEQGDRPATKWESIYG